MRRLFIILLLLLAISCSNNPADPDPAGVRAEASSPADAYTGNAVNFSASCSSIDGIESATLQFSSPDVDQNFTRTEAVNGNNFSESFSVSFNSEGEASLQISCTSTLGVSNTAQTTTAIEQFTTGLYLELRNAANGELQEGYVLAGDDSLYTETGIIDVDITDPSVNSIRSGLSTSSNNGFGKFASFLRESSVVSGQNNSLELYHLDFAFREITNGNVIGHLSTSGYDRDGDMDLERFLLHIDENIFYNGMLKRWKDPIQRIVFAAAVNRTNIGSINSFDHPDLLFDTYKQQWEEIMQPHLVENLPFERVDHFVYSGEEAVNGMIVIAPADIDALGTISLFRDVSGVNVGSFISVRDVLPDKNIRPDSYAIALNRVFLHEIYSALINPGRSSTHTRPEESILTGSDSLLNQISNEDSKVLYELSQNPRIDFDELVSEYLILPNGF